MQAHYPLIQRVAPSVADAVNGTAMQAGGPYRYLLKANYTGEALSSVECMSVPDWAMS